MIPIVDLNELARQLANGALTIHGVYMTNLQPGRYYGHTPSRPTPHAGFVFALRGHAVFECNGTPYDLYPGRIVHGAKQMALRVTVGPSGFEYALIHYSLTPPAGEGEGYTGTHYVLETVENPQIVETLRLLQTAMTTPGHLQSVRSKALFYSTVYQMISSARNRRNAESQNTMEHAIQYIHGHYMEPLSLSKLAGLYDMDEKKFAYAFNKYVGMFPIDYVIQHRIRRAGQLLATSHCSVRDIAESVGYSDAHYFSRLFKKHVGCTLSEFRSRSGNNPPVF
ncbi:AraC family transcriptional regulator [Brevibacillus humidisoli]|uniref:AraC family transcriptional regulator n=1 Tax=Brevibacillus humidisoli TaxID=2895522 RepID=UPI001E558F3F|nr:AraC family transcriptional regulator [Brevibacillus humidisoli]UFJ40709.1 AraC family transcriptional regulator [Brevibacillus humidisoli]